MSFLLPKLRQLFFHQQKDLLSLADQFSLKKGPMASQNRSYCEDTFSVKSNPVNSESIHFNHTDADEQPTSDVLAENPELVN